MERTDLLDTTIEMHRLKLKLFREKGPAWRVQKALEMTDASRMMFPEQTARALRKAKSGP